MKAFTTSSAFRRSLEQRLATNATETGVPLNRLRKEAASQRLLARLSMGLPEDSWALKGGLALVARLDSKARATKDIDTTWREDARQLSDLIDDALDQDLGDHFEFTIGAPQEIEAEGPEGGLRFRVTAYLDGREFERLRLDVNVVPHDSRPIEVTQIRNPFEFADIAAPSIPVIPIGQHLAEKLHAYCRSYGTQVNSRVKDLYDMLVIAEQLPIPRLDELQDICIDTFDLRETSWPPHLVEPPTEWKNAWSGFVDDHAIKWISLEYAYDALAAFWSPVTSDFREQYSWDSQSWKWSW